MLILSVRTDKPQAEVGLFDDYQQLAYETWEAHRQLAETLHRKIHGLLQEQKADWHDIQAIVCFQGPGSFTGLRIGLTVANSLAVNIGVPIVASSGADWLQQGIKQLLAGHNDVTALPNYGSDAHITKQKK